eukprot:scaffold260911_cov22-Tisochrysis_lutea.AAC.1
MFITRRSTASIASLPFSPMLTVACSAQVGMSSPGSALRTRRAAQRPLAARSFMLDFGTSSTICAFFSRWRSKKERPSSVSSPSDSVSA